MILIHQGPGFVSEMPAELSSRCRCCGYMVIRMTASISSLAYAKWRVIRAATSTGMEVRTKSSTLDGSRNLTWPTRAASLSAETLALGTVLIYSIKLDPMFKGQS